MEQEEKSEGGGMRKIAAFIVDKRNLFFLLYVVALVFCLFSRNWVEVENDITTYLPEETETRRGLTVMNDNFITYGSARVMITNVTQERAQALADQVADLDGVSRVTFDNSEDHYRGTAALLDVSFDGTETDQVSIDAMEKINELLEPYDSYVDTTVGEDSSADLAKEMGVIVLIAAVIIVVVLTLTSKAYMEVPVLVMTFGAAALLNMGTNFLCGKISFISNSVTVVLQLALAIDYAIILCHRFSAEHVTLDTRGADQGHFAEPAVRVHPDAGPAGAVLQSDRQDPAQGAAAQDHGHRQARCEDPLHRAASVCGAYGVCLLLRQPLPLCLYLQ